MRFIFFIIEKYRFFFLFLILQTISLFLTFQFRIYQRSKIISSANFISGAIYDGFSSLKIYLFLERENELLIQENIRLHNLLLSHPLKKENIIDSIDNQHRQKFKYFSAKIINNDFYKQNNYLTMNKGKNQGVDIDMAVVNSKGIVGIVNDVSRNYATVISALNMNFRINARLKKSDYFGTILWNNKSKDELELKDIPKEAILKMGDTIVTGGYSAIFPEGVLIGKINNIVRKNQSYYHIAVKPFNNFKMISNVFIIKNLEKNEIKTLEKKRNE